MLASFEAAVNTRLSELHQQGRRAPATDVLARNAHLSAKEAARRERRAAALAKTKAFGEALANGDVAAEHADVLADLTTKLDDELQASFFGREPGTGRQSHELVAGTVRPALPQRDRRLEHDQGIERNRQQRRDTYLTFSVQRDGMHRISGLLHPELGAAIFTAVDKELADTARRQPRRLGPLDSSPPRRSATWSRADIKPCDHWKPTCSCSVDHTTITDGLHEHSVCETDTGALLPPKRSDACAATGGSCRSSSSTASRSTSAANNASPTAPNAAPCARCTAAAGSGPARHRSTAAKSTTSCGGNSAAKPT